jgi:hypothetical protein
MGIVSMKKQKYCWYCDKNLNVSLFHKCSKRPDGLQGMCKNCHKKYRKEWMNKNLDKYKESCQTWQKNNQHKIYIRQKKWREKNKEYFRKQQREYKANRRKIDDNFRITSNLRNRVRKAIKGINKSQKTMQLLGCDIDSFKLYIERKFKQGMHWSNYGQWELDHIKPCCSFDLSNIVEQKKCFHYSNIQPLWKKEHRQKTKLDTKKYC